MVKNQGGIEMMTSDDYQHFVCIVAGDNPEELMTEYDKNKTVEPYVVYTREGIPRLKELFIDEYTKALEENTLNESQEEYVKSMIQDLAEMDDDEFFYELVTNDNLTIGEDGNAYSDKNKWGKWSSHSIGKLFSVPFVLKDGREVFQAKKSEIDWSVVHLSGGEIYARAWEMVMEESKPQNDYEETIYKNMHDKQAYFEKFETKDNYVASNTAFWGYAFLSDKTGWRDADNEEQFSWMKNFYDMFIKNLDDDTLLTIYECNK
jgi:hypothetical protein